MSSTYEITLFSPAGERLTLLKHISMELARRRGDVGALTLTLDPSLYDFNMLNQRDARIVIERSVRGGQPYVEGRTTWFVRKATLSGGINQPESIKLTALDANCLLNRRIVAYYPEEPETEKEEMPVLDIILEILRENLGGDAIAARDLSNYLYIPPATTNYGPVHSINLAWQEVGNTIKELIEVAKAGDTTLSLDIQLQSIEPLKLIVVVGKTIGTDRTESSGIVPGGGLLIGPDYGNFDDWTLEYDYTNELSYLYGGGEGDDDDRLIVEIQNSAAVNASPFGRIEGWDENPEADITEQLETWMIGRLQKRITRPKITGRIAEGEQLIWGENLNFGDIVPVQVKGNLYNCIIESYQLRNTPSGGDELNIIAESV